METRRAILLEEETELGVVVKGEEEEQLGEWLVLEKTEELRAEGREHLQHETSKVREGQRRPQQRAEGSDEVGLRDVRGGVVLTGDGGVDHASVLLGVRQCLFSAEEESLR